MKQSLQLRLKQQLSITPQLQQAIKLLQLSSLDLITEIRQAVESNPLLEFEDNFDDAPPDADDSGTVENLAEDSTDIDTRDQAAADYSAREEDLPWSSRTSSSSQNQYTGADKPLDYPETSQTLHSYLASQINILPLSDTDRLIADAIIDSINQDGYLEVSPDEIHASFDASLEISTEEVFAVLNMIQHLDPAGVGARDIRDSLRIQLLQNSSSADENGQIALRIINDQFDLLCRRDYAAIARQLQVEIEDVQHAVELIQQLNPRPGSAIDSIPTEYITPDVLVRKHKGRWQVSLNGDIAPQIKVNDYYASMIKRADNSRDNQFLKNNLQEARWFLKSLSNRNDTLLKVASLIVEQQQDFLEHGEEHMKPMVLRDIADAIEMHESTISRVTTQKYMHTPRGIFELKYFFSSHVSTASGGECSSTAIRAMIKKLVTDEDDRKPFSDNKLAQLLEQRGIKVARRTVAKYRESLLIPPSNERRLRA